MRNSGAILPKQLSEIISVFVLKMQALMLGDMLQQTKGYNAIYSLDSSVHKLDDASYFYTLKEINSNPKAKEQIIKNILGLCRDEYDDGKPRPLNINDFQSSQHEDMKEISSQVRLRYVRNFFDQELVRLESSGVVADPATYFAKREEEKNKTILVDDLIKQSQQGVKIRLNKDTFSILIKDYFRSSDIYSSNPSKNQEFGKRAFRDIAKIIREGDNYDWLKGDEIKKDDNLKLNSVCFVHSMCKLGDINTLKTLMQLIGDENLKISLLSIPQDKKAEEHQFSGLITLKGIFSIIEKRIAKETQKPKDASTTNTNLVEWQEVHRKFATLSGTDRAISDSRVGVDPASSLSHVLHAMAIDDRSNERGAKK